MRFTRLFLLITLFLASRSSHANNPTDSLENVLKTAKHDTIKIKALGDLFWEYSFSDLDKAESYAKQEVDLAITIKKPEAIAQGFNDLGIVRFKKGDLDGALDNYRKSYELRKGTGNKGQMASSLSKIGVTYYEMGNYRESLKAQLAALKLFEEIDHKTYIAYTLNNLGQLYQRLNDYDKSIEYSQKAYEYCEQIGDKHGMATSIGNIGFVHQAKKDYTKAIECDLKALELFEALGDKSNLSNVLNNIGALYRTKGDSKTGLIYYQRALDISREMDDKSGLALYTSNIANLYTDMGQFALAEQAFREAQETAEKNRLKPLQKSIYKSFARFYTKKNDYKDAYAYMELFTAINDSLYTEESAKQIAEMQTKYETEKKEQQIALLEQQQKIKDLEINQNKLQIDNQRTQLFVVIGTFVFIIILAFLFYNRYKLKQKQLMNEELLRQEKLRLKAVINTQEAERKRIAEELHDGIGQMLSAVKLNVASLDIVDGKDTQFKNAIDLIDDSCRELRTISHNMMPGILVKAGLVPALKEYASKINDTGALSIFIEADEELPKRFDDVTEINLFRIVQELVTNIIKYAKATEAHISMNKTDEGLSLMIEDNGQGLDKEQLASGTGNGWYNINSRIGVLNGKIEIDSSPGKGTAVFIEVPQLINV